MRLNRDGTMQSDGDETKITRFSYRNKNLIIGGMAVLVEMEVAIVGEFDRMIAITQGLDCMVLPRAEALKLARAILRAVPRAKKEQKHLQAKQDAHSRQEDLQRLRQLHRRAKIRDPITGDQTISVPEAKELKDLDKKYGRKPTKAESEKMREQQAPGHW